MSEEKVVTDGSGVTEYMLSMMKNGAPSGDVAAFMAPGNSDEGSTSEQANRPSVSAKVSVSTGRKLS